MSALNIQKTRLFKKDETGFKIFPYWICQPNIRLTENAKKNQDELMRKENLSDENNKPTNDEPQVGKVGANFKLLLKIEELEKKIKSHNETNQSPLTQISELIRCLKNAKKNQDELMRKENLSDENNKPTNDEPQVGKVGANFKLLLKIEELEKKIKSHNETNQSPLTQISELIRCLIELNSWKVLQKHYEEVGKHLIMKDLFSQDPHRFDTFSRQFKGECTGFSILLDYSKNIITKDTFNTLIELVKEARVEEFRDKIPRIALRNVSNNPICDNGVNVVPEVNKVLEQMRNTSDAIRNGKWTGYTGKAIVDIVNIGIGGCN
ncbi:hypothetical protein Glove_123g149 [Diversispora epigaea]|uniref:Uncharacterized protein n=1 Tax=Diversispora epigaea TaxID=1348612 RepID=A0A397J1B2_9GLOM|nr:hypothetical protein Glove_123g149 [Diversispora epigaea]